MTTIPFSADWTYRRPVGPFAIASDTQVPTPVRLPHDALRDEERRADAPGRGAGAYYPAGAYTYLKDFEVPAEWAGKVISLEFQGAFRRAQVLINDEFAGNRADGYARFFVDVTPYLRFGETNTVRVEVRTGEDSRWYSGAGLHRPVVLHVEDAIDLVSDEVELRTLRIEADQAVVESRATVTNRTLVTETVRVRTEIFDAGGALVERDEVPLTLAPGEAATQRQVFYIPSPALWSPDAPHLYTVEVSLAGRESRTRVPFGIRTVTVDPRKGLRINGEEVLLRGACIHHDNGPLGAAAIGRAEERRIELLKAAGFNAIRAAHNPLSVAMLDACDRLGMLVMDEAFDVWTRFKTLYDSAAEFPQWWRADLESMVRKDRNHPSVIMYSIGNEIAEVGTPHGARWARQLADCVRELDPTRPITNGVNVFLAMHDEVARVIEELGGLNAAMGADGGPFNAVGATPAASARIEESSAVLDVVGLNYAEARYALDGVQYPHRVIVGSETFPSEIGRLWPMIVANPHVIGDFTWTGWDYLGEVGIGSMTYADEPGASGQLEREFPYRTAWCGDLDITGWRRPASYYREIVFGLRTEPYISVLRPDRHGVEVTTLSHWAWSDSVASWTWQGSEGRPVTVEVYADGDEVQLLLDDKVVGTAQVGARRPMLATIETEYRPGTLTAVVLRGGEEIGRTSLATAGTPTLTVSVDRSELVANDDDLAFIAIEMRDSEGRLVMDSDAEVSVVVEGAGTLAGMTSANPVTTERFDSATWRTFDGRALAVVRPDAVGTITVRVSGLGEVITRELTVSLAEG